MKTLLLGDLSPTRDTCDLYVNGELEALFGDIPTLFEGNDVNLINLECAITEHDQGIEKFGPCIKVPSAGVKTIKALGVTHACLSNNHFFDFGKKGALDSLAALDSVGIVYTGFGENEQDAKRDLIIEKDGERIALICVCEHEYSYALPDRMGARAFDEFETMLEIANAKKNADRVIVTYHGGKEQCEYPSPRLRKACRAMAAHGADVVLCQHSHCIGCYEEYEGCHILYGQGNFHFAFIGREEPENWYTSLAVRYDTKSDEIEFIPLMQGEGVNMHIAKGEDAARIMGGFEKRNAELQNGEWRRGWHEFCLSKEGHYTRSVARAYVPEATDRHNHCFAHYIDCEAHLDVWRELFPTANLTNEK